MAEPLVVIYLSDNLIRVLDLVDNSGAPGSTPVPVVSATVTANVKDGSGAAVARLGNYYGLPTWAAGG